MEENRNNAPAATNKSAQSVDRPEEKLIDAEISLNDLLRILRMKEIAMGTERAEKEEQKREAEEVRLKAVLGADYEAFAEGRPDQRMEKVRRRPGAVQLRKEAPRIAVKKVGINGLCEAFANGYAVYDNGDRKTVVWIADCSSATYHFTKLRDNEKLYQVEKDTVGDDILGPAPWYIAVAIRGEDTIERNLDHPKSLGTMSDSEKMEKWEAKRNHRWLSGCHIENPEDAYIRKEAREERRALLSKKQKEAYDLYFEEGCSHRQIAQILGVNHRAVGCRLNTVVTILEENLEKILP